MKLKKLLSSILSIAILMTVTMSFAFATDTHEIQSDITSYINDVLPNYLSIEKQSDYSNIQISQGLEVNGNPDDNMRTFFVTDNGEYIACLMVTSVGGTFYSSFHFDENEDIDTAIEKKEPIALFTFDKGLFMQTSNDVVELSAVELTQEDEQAQKLNLMDYTLTEITLNDTGFAPTDIQNKSIAARATSYSVSLNVPYVANAYSPEGAGLCWAACISAVLNYRVSTTWTALNLYNQLDFLYNGTPIGEEPWLSRGFLQGQLVATVTGGLNFLDMYTSLGNNRPVILYISTATGSPSHLIVCKFLYSDLYAGTIYGFMDPNYSTTRYSSYSTPDKSINNSSFVYVGGSTTYTWWYQAIR